MKNIAKTPPLVAFQITGAAPEDLKLKLGSLALQVGDNPENTIHIDRFDPNNPEASAGFGLVQFIREKSTKPPQPISSNGSFWRNAA